MATATATATHRTARAYVQGRTPFKGSNLFGVQANVNTYAVYSYGRHWPLYAYCASSNTWFENSDNKHRSRTTTHHASCTHPQVQTYPMDTETLTNFIYQNGGTPT